MKVLIVEDNELVRAMIEFAVDQADHISVSVCNGREAWELLDRGERFDHIISDNDMLEMTGVELLRQVRADARTACVPFTLMSGANHVSLKEICERNTAVFLAKPFDIFTLLSLLGVEVFIEE